MVLIGMIRYNDDEIKSFYYLFNQNNRRLVSLKYLSLKRVVVLGSLINNTKEAKQVSIGI